MPVKPVERRVPVFRRQSSTPHYQTFDTIPPRSRGKPASASPRPTPEGGPSRSPSNDRDRLENPLPKTQMMVLAVIAFCEQTALNSISPYLPEMAASFPSVNPTQIGLYVGTIASAFALAQLMTNFFWGWLSDQIGRKPIIMTGTFLTAACFVAFGFCKNLWQAALVQALMGSFNGNQAVVSTCLGEITDSTNQSKAFTWLPAIYGIGGITGPLIGGLLVSQRNPLDPTRPNPYPYLAPNIVAAAILLLDLLITAVFLEESLDGANDLPPLKHTVRSLFAWAWQFASSANHPTYTRGRSKHSTQRPLLERRWNQGELSDTEEVDETDDVHDYPDDDYDHADAVSFPTWRVDRSAEEESTVKDAISRDTVLLLLGYLIFQLCNISYNSLFPIFASTPLPTGRALSPSVIGLLLGFAGVFTIIFQIGFFGKIRDRIGNRYAFRTSLAVFMLAFLITPWVGYRQTSIDDAWISGNRRWLWVELGMVLLVKTMAAVGGLTSALLLITNAAPSPSVLGRLNGLAQTLSAAGRAAGPFVSGSLFSAATEMRPSGEVFAFSVFGGVAFIGFLVSLGIRSRKLEGEGSSEDQSVKSTDPER